MIEYYIDIQRGGSIAAAGCGIAQDISAAAHDVARTVRLLLRDGNAQQDDIITVSGCDGSLLWSSTVADKFKQRA